MALRKIREYGDEILTKKCREVKEMTPRLKELVADMLDTMYHAEGVGLAAPQVGVLRRICVIDIGEGPIVLVNPKIVEQDGEQEGNEGCLSVPGKAGVVIRPNHVIAEGFDENMNPVTIEGEELLARAICHELDHLEGIMYTTRVEGELFDTADEAEEGREATLRQLECFKDAVGRLKADGCNFDIVHCSNSGAVIDYRQAHFDCVRAGIILYGLSPSQKLAGRLDIRQAMQIKSVVAQVKTIEAGTPVSYGGTFVSEKKMKIATVPIGYADGYSRSLGNKAYMTVRGKKAPVIGRVCMDQLMLDVSGIDDVCTGDEVIVIGDGSNNTLSFDEMAQMTGTINYELVCLVGKRVPRVYIHHGRNVGIMDSIRPANEE